MKKIIIICICIFLCGCNQEYKNAHVEEHNKKIEETDINLNINDKEEKYIDDNPIIVGLYNGNNLITDYEFNEQSMKDIGVFTTFFTNDEYLTNSNKYTWMNYYNKYETDISNYKIGYNIIFEDNGTTYNKNILGPEAMYYFDPYLYIYLYDDINQLDGAWYSHVEENEVNENTIFSSIKLFQVTDHFSSPIKLTVFTYDSNDDFDNEGNYRGNSKYTINIIPK